MKFNNNYTKKKKNEVITPTDRYLSELDGDTYGLFM